MCGIATDAEYALPQDADAKLSAQIHESNAAPVPVRLVLVLWLLDLEIFVLLGAVHVLNFEISGGAHHLSLPTKEAPHA
jgi:hypothetical protein